MGGSKGFAAKHRLTNAGLFRQLSQIVGTADGISGLHFSRLARQMDRQTNGAVDRGSWGEPVHRHFST
jgi:hypothetical protein